MGFLKSLLANILGFFISIFLIILIFIGIIAGIASSAGKKEVKVEEGSVLRLTFDNTIPEQPKRNPFEGLAALSDDFKTPVALKDILDCINTAKTDKNIKGIYMDLGLASNSYPTLDEVRNALLDFKKSGKFIYAYSEIYTQHSYYLASVADKVFINPQGAMDFTGFHSEQMFLKGLFDKLDVDMKLIRAGKYKSAGEMFNRKDMSAANREQLTAFINSSFNDFINKIADSRKISGDELRKISNELLVRFPADAVKYKLVDELAYKDQVLAALQAKLKKGAKDKIEFVDASEYTNIAEHNTSGGKDKIALIYAVGEIAGGEGSENSIGSEKLSKTIRKAREDDKIKAIVLRINSPGGSALASDIIWREVVLAQKKKP
ncbi:MAG: S49 family peptidase, partial [Bacteroidetes bacterium]|nr:S49 family peptidase [Bacteroidota bacterium]